MSELKLVQRVPIYTFHDEVEQSSNCGTEEITLYERKVLDNNEGVKVVVVGKKNILDEIQVAAEGVTLSEIMSKFVRGDGNFPSQELGTYEDISMYPEDPIEALMFARQTEEDVALVSQQMSLRELELENNRAENENKPKKKVKEIEDEVQEQ